jgi:glucose-6-phosphate dehydrogenase assembly protein OpcA
MPAGVQPERILKELAGLWAGMSKDQSQGTNSGVLRACAMTLVVAAESDQDATDSSGVLAELMHAHPSRAIVLRPSAEPGAMEARVFAQCWMPFGKRQQICCEQIEITASRDRLDEVPAAILGIMVPDLPVVLWARGREWLSAPEFQLVLPLVQKLIIDSEKLGDPTDGVLRPFTLMRTLQAESTLVGDLAWTRLTALRQAISHMLEDAALVPRLKSVEDIAVLYGDHPISGAYLAAWLQSGLPRAKVTLEHRKGDSSSIHLRGQGVGLAIELGPSLVIRTDGAEYRTVLSVPGECDLMREELSILEADPVFTAVFEIAERLIKGGVSA